MAVYKRKYPGAFRARKRYKPRTRTIGTQTAAAYGFARAARMLGSELKFKDYDRANQTLNTTWTVHDPAPEQCFNAMTQTSGSNSRDGRVSTNVSLQIKGHVEFQNVSEENPNPRNYARIIVFWDTQTNKAAPVAADVMQGNSTRNILQFYELQNTTRFKILRDFKLIEPPRGLATSATVGEIDSYNNFVPFNVYIKLRNKRTNHTGTAGTIGDINDNSLHIIACMATSTTEGVIEYTARLRFRG